MIMNRTLGLYIHIPFCRSKCDYCDFYSMPGREDRMDAYQEALLLQIEENASRLKNYTVNTIYIGGGTPTWYGESRLCELLRLLKKKFRLSRDVEITVEGNPDSVTEKQLKRLRKEGVNRLSMGMQSACDQELKDIHRPHNYQQVTDAVAAARKAKIGNLNLDLIYGLPNQTEASWHDSVEKALALEPEHLSCYGLTVEEGTPLWNRVASGEKLPDDDTQASFYLWMVERLKQSGYEQYEISNFSKPGYESRHNLKYWMGEEYLGLGAGAHSDLGGYRFACVRDMEGYIRGMMNGERLLSENDQIPLRERSSEYLMLRLRTTRGIEGQEYQWTYYMNFEPIEKKMAEFEKQGWAVQQNKRWRLTPEGFLLSNRLIVELLELQEAVTLQQKIQYHTCDRTEEIPAAERKKKTRGRKRNQGESR